MKKNLLGVLVSKSGEMHPVSIHDDLDNFYDILECNCIDIVVRKIGGAEYDIVCDDEGLLKGEPVFTAVDKKYQPALVGNLFICKSDLESGELVSLTEDEMLAVMKHRIQAISFNSDSMFRDVLVLDE